MLVLADALPHSRRMMLPRPSWAEHRDNTAGSAFTAQGPGIQPRSHVHVEKPPMTGDRGKSQIFVKSHKSAQVFGGV